MRRYDSKKWATLRLLSTFCAMHATSIHKLQKFIISWLLFYVDMKKDAVAREYFEKAASLDPKTQLIKRN